jgi:hypothetical protein
VPSFGAARRAAALGILALASAAAGCKERLEEPAGMVRDFPGPRPFDGKPAKVPQWEAPADSSEPAVFLKAFDPGIRVSRFSQVEIAAGRVRQRRSVQLLGSFIGGDGVELVARSGNDLVVATAIASPAGLPAHRLVRPYALGAKDVPLGDFPVASLGFVGRRAFVGGRGILGTVDFASAEPKLEILLRAPRPASEGAFTLMAADADRLVAVQGALAPFFADEFRLREAALPEHDQRLFLPPVAGRYAGAALFGPELVLLAEFDGKEGRGKAFRRIAHGSPADAHLRTVPGLADGFEEAGEWEATAPGGKGSAARSAWRGIALVGAMMVTCAGERGAMVLPRAFSERTRPLFVDVDGVCIDLVGSSGKAYAVVKAGQGMRIVALADSPEGLGVEASYAITGLWSGLVP